MQSLESKGECEGKYEDESEDEEVEQEHASLWLQYMLPSWLTH